MKIQINLSSFFIDHINIKNNYMSLAIIRRKLKNTISYYNISPVLACLAVCIGLSVTYPVQERSWSVRGTFCPFLMRCTFVLSGTCPLLVRWSPLLVRWSPFRVRYLSGTCPVLVRYLSVLRSSREPRAAAGSTFTNGRPTDWDFWQFFHPLDVRSRCPVRCDWAIKLKVKAIFLT